MKLLLDTNIFLEVILEHIRNKLESAGFKLNFATKGFILFASRDRSL